MAIKYTIIEKPEPGVIGGGIKKWYANAKADGEITIDDLCKAIERSSSLTESDIRAVIIAVVNEIIVRILAGNIVRLDKLGSFYPSLSSNGADREEDFTQSYIKGAKMNYRAAATILDALKTAKFSKVK